MITLHRAVLATAAAVSLTACVAPGSAPQAGADASSSEVKSAAAAPASSEAKAAPAEAVKRVEAPPASYEMPAYAVGDRCVYERAVNGRKQTETRVVSEITGGKLVWTSSMDKGGTSRVEMDAATMDAHRDVALANNQDIAFASPYRWMDLPLSAGKTWETQSVVKGQTFTADLKVKASAERWESVKVPAGEYKALKVTLKERIYANGSHGTGALTYWVTSGSKCLLKATYSNSWGERGQVLLVASGQ